MIPHEIHIVGLGGTGMWVLQCLCKLPIQGSITLHDRDIIEPRNLDRQLFGPDCIGKNKAQAAAALVRPPKDTRIEVVEQWFTGATLVGAGALIIACADNHPARLAVIQKADRTPCTAIICGNEYEEADAYFYSPKMRDTPNDPRVFAPEIATDQTGNPDHPVGCTGLAQAMSPQLSIANMTSAAFAMRLLWWWFEVAPKQDRKEMPYWPVRLGCSAQRCWTVRFNGEMR